MTANAEPAAALDIPSGDSAAFSRIALFAHSEWRGFLLGLARMMRDRDGSELHLYVATEQERAYYENLNGAKIFTSIIDIGTLADVAMTPVAPDDEAEIIASARMLESRYGVTINRLTASNRHFGRGYSLGGFRHPRSRQSEGTGYFQVLNAYTRKLAFWEEEFTGKRISLLLNGTVEAQVAAHARGVPCRSPIGARYGNYLYWCENEFFESEAVLRSYAAIPSAPERSLTAPYDSHMQYRKTFMSSLRARIALWRMARTLVQHLYWRLRGYDKAKGYYMRDEILFHWRVWRANRELTGPKVASLEDMQDKPFVFFPLHAEPESSLQQASPEYFFQLGAIASIARDLPAGYYLAVKDTYQTYGRRPDNFYDQIREFKNVVLLDMLELGLEVARQAEAVVTITGTAGFEAAVMGKPVVSLGRHNLYNVLPHVTVVDREEDLAPALHQALFGDLDATQARADAARYVQAVIDNSFDMESYDIRHPDVVPQGVVESAYRCLLNGLQVTAAEDRPAAMA